MEQLRITAIIQARMGSTRLPNKVMKKAANKPLIQHLIERLSNSSLIEEIVLATTQRPIDDALAEFIQGLGYKVFRGEVVAVEYKPRACS